MNSGGIKSLTRALQLLETLRATPEGLELRTIATRTSLPKGTAHRILGTLVKHGFVEQDKGVYRIGVRAFVVGSAFLAHLDLRTKALPYLFELRNRTGETVQLAILENFHVVYIERVLSQFPIAYMKSRVGAVIPAYCTGLGKAMLAFSTPEIVQRYLDTVRLEPFTEHTITDPARFVEELNETRWRGYAIDRGEREESVRCVAAPIFNHEGIVIAAVSVAGPAERMSWPLEGSPLAEKVIEIAHQVSAVIGYAPLHST